MDNSVKYFCYKRKMETTVVRGQGQKGDISACLCAGGKGLLERGDGLKQERCS